MERDRCGVPAEKVRQAKKRRALVLVQPKLRANFVGDRPKIAAAVLATGALESIAGVCSKSNCISFGMAARSDCVLKSRIAGSFNCIGSSRSRPSQKVPKSIFTF
jgi:hypothetical protein